jgi:hypothetical protein
MQKVPDTFSAQYYSYYGDPTGGPTTGKERWVVVNSTVSPNKMLSGYSRLTRGAMCTLPGIPWAVDLRAPPRFDMELGQLLSMLPGFMPGQSIVREQTS